MLMTFLEKLVEELLAEIIENLLKEFLIDFSNNTCRNFGAIYENSLNHSNPKQICSKPLE